jgi:hypothetical protein
VGTEHIQVIVADSDVVQETGMDVGIAGGDNGGTLGERLDRSDHAGVR